MNPSNLAKTTRLLTLALLALAGGAHAGWEARVLSMPAGFQVDQMRSEGELLEDLGEAFGHQLPSSRTTTCGTIGYVTSMPSRFTSDASDRFERKSVVEVDGTEVHLYIGAVSGDLALAARDRDPVFVLEAAVAEQPVEVTWLESDLDEGGRVLLAAFDRAIVTESASTQGYAHEAFLRELLISPYGLLDAGEPADRGAAAIEAELVVTTWFAFSDRSEGKELAKRAIEVLRKTLGENPHGLELEVASAPGSETRFLGN